MDEHDLEKDLQSNIERCEIGINHVCNFMRPKHV